MCLDCAGFAVFVIRYHTVSKAVKGDGEFVGRMKKYIEMKRLTHAVFIFKFRELFRLFNGQTDVGDLVI